MDNVTIPATGSGSVTPVVATDEVAGAHYQYMKLVDGTADSAEKIAGDATYGLDVDVTRLPAPLTIIGGGAEASALRVTIASDSTGILSVDDNGGSLTIDGSVSATQSGTWNISTLSTITNVVHVDDNGSSVTVDGSVTANAGTGFATVVTDGSAAGTTGIHVLGSDGSNAQILSTNSSGHINIADGGNTITVDGTVTVGSITTGNNVIGQVKLTDGTDIADILDLTNSNPLTVAIVDDSGDYPLISEIDSIDYYVYNMEDRSTQIDTGTLSPASVFFDSLQTGNSWTQDSTGYNFLHTFADTALWETGKYRIKYKFTMNSGSVFWCVFGVVVRPSS